MKKLLRSIIPVILVLSLLFSMSAVINAEETKEVSAVRSVMSIKPNEEKIYQLISALANDGEPLPDNMKSMVKPFIDMLSKLRLKQEVSKNDDTFIQKIELGTDAANLLDLYAEINSKEKTFKFASNLIKNKVFSFTEKELSEELKASNGAAFLNSVFSSLENAKFQPKAGFEDLNAYMKALNNAFEKTLKAKLTLEEGDFKFDNLEKLTKKYSGEITSNDLKDFLFALAEEKGFEPLKAQLEKITNAEEIKDNTALLFTLYTDDTNFGISLADKEDRAHISMSAAPNEKKLNMEITAKQNSNFVEFKLSVDNQSFKASVNSNGVKLGIAGKAETSENPFKQTLNVDFMFNDEEPLFTLTVEINEIEKFSPMDMSNQEVISLEKLKSLKDPSEVLGSVEDFQKELDSRLQKAFPDEYTFINAMLQNLIPAQK